MASAKLSHAAPLTWHSRAAPLSQLAAHAPTWRERAAQHRAALGLHPAGPKVAPLSGHDLAASPAGDSLLDDDVDVLAPEAPVPPEPPTWQDGEEIDGDWWGTVMRVDLARYLRFKNAQLHDDARRGDHRSVPSLEHTDVWRVVLEVLATERHTLRRDDRSSGWPDAIHSVAKAKDHHADTVLADKLRTWIGAVEDVADHMHDEDAREALREVPVAALLRQALADLQVAAGDLSQASETLVRAVRTGPGDSHPHNTPLVDFWEDYIRCGYVRAHQCLRLGRVALLSIQVLMDSAQEDEKAYTQELRARRVAARREAIGKGATRARRHLQAARALFDAELARLGDALAAPSLGTVEAEHWCLALCCARLAASTLLAEALQAEGRGAEAVALLQEASREASELQCDEAASAQLRRLLHEERARLAERAAQLGVAH